MDFSYVLLVAFVWLIRILIGLILVRALISWVPPMAQSHVGRLITALTEPVLAPTRWLLSRIPALQRLPVDFSPIAAWLVLYGIQWIIVQLYYLFH